MARRVFSFDTSTGRFRDANGKFISKQRGLRSPNARQEYESAIIEFETVNYYSALRAANKPTRKRRAISSSVSELPSGPVISDIGSFSTPTLKFGSLVKAGRADVYLESVLGVEDIDPDQEDETGEEF